MNRPIVDTESGSAAGTVEDGVAAFRGIPYAASPVGDLRFAAPQRHPKWPGPRDASRPGPSVPQHASRLAEQLSRMCCEVVHQRRTICFGGLHVFAGFTILGCSYGVLRQKGSNTH